jgi:hypothetical protein
MRQCPEIIRKLSARGYVGRLAWAINFDFAAGRRGKADPDAGSKLRRR